MAMAEESVKVLHSWRSMFGLRVLIALKEKGVEYEYQEEDPANKSQLLLDSNPVHKKIPVLLHNGRAICESLIIVQYIDEAWPSLDKPFLPSHPFQHALTRFWADYVDKKVFEAGGLIVRNTEGGLMEKGRRDLIECMITLDAALRDIFGGGPYFGGNHMGLVDIALAPYVCWFETFENIGNFKILEERKCPHLFAWATLVLDHPSVKEALSIAPPTKILESICSMRKNLWGL